MTASNDGMVKVWSISIQSKEEIKTKLVTSIDTKCRVTCMIVHKVPPLAQHQEDDKSGMVSNKNSRLKMDKSQYCFLLLIFCPIGCVSVVEAACKVKLTH